MIELYVNGKAKIVIHQETEIEKNEEDKDVTIVTIKEMEKINLII